MIPTTYKVGSFYQEFIHPDNLIRADYNGTAWTLTIGFPGITDQEINELQSGDMRATFTVINDSLFILTKIGAFDWFDFPYEPRLNRVEDADAFYPEFEHKGRVLRWSFSLWTHTAESSAVCASWD